MQARAEDPAPSILSLPVEILAKIFLDGTQMWKDHSPQGLPFPTSVTGVCLYWRGVAEGMPELWTFILPPLHKELEDCVDWTTKWLERSGTMLVSVVLDDMTVTTDLKGPVAAATERKIVKVLSLLLQHPHRLRRLDVRSASFGAFKKFMRDLWDAPNLEQLSLCSRQWIGLGYFFQPNEDHLKWSVLPRLAKLRKFRFWNISPPLIPTLTSLTARDLKLNYHGTRALFTGCPHLAHLVVHNLPPSAPRQHPAHYPTITVPSLVSLAVEVMNWELDEPDNFYPFSFLDLPNLLYLEIRGDLPLLSNLFGSSLASATVKKLRLSNMSRLLDDAQFFHQLCNLQELEIFDIPAGKLYPSASGSSHGSSDHASRSSTRWPYLHSITLHTHDLNVLFSTLDYIAGRYDSGLQSCVISQTALQLLEEGDEASEDHSRFLSRFGKDGGRKWLEGLVEVTLLEDPAYGLLDGERVPMAEMP